MADSVESQATKGQQFLGNVALVTGSNSGIGEGIALRLAKLGASVTLCGRDVPRLEAVYQKCIEASGGHSSRFIMVPGDLTDSSYRSKLLMTTVERFGKLDVLVCNAGIGSATDDSLTSASEEFFDSIVNTNLKASFFLIQKAVPYLNETHGNIVVISSIASTLSHSATIYAMTKAAIDHMVRCLALDLAPMGIRINSVNPSHVVTGILRKVPPGTTVEEIWSAFLSSECPKHPLGNRLVTFEELAEGVAFLASDSASFITGQNLTIDGGRSFMGSLH